RCGQPVLSRGRLGDPGPPVHLPVPPAVRSPGAGGCAAAAVMGGVDRDAVEPGGEARLAPPGPELCGKGEADVLGEVLGLGTSAGEPEREPEYALVMPLEKHREGVAVSSCGGTGQSLVRGLHAHDETLTRAGGQSLGDDEMRGPRPPPASVGSAEDRVIELVRATHRVELRGAGG